MNWYKILKQAQFLPLKSIFDIGHLSFDKGEKVEGCKEYLWIWTPTPGSQLEVVEITEENPNAAHLHVWGQEKEDSSFKGRAENCGLEETKVSVVPLYDYKVENYKPIPKILVSYLKSYFGNDIQIYNYGQ